jgi:hypothetical protein
LGSIGCALMFEVDGLTGDPWADLGNKYLADLTSWTGFHIIFNLFEICMTLTAVVWLLTRKRERGAHIRRSLTVPMAVFAATLAFGVLNGIAQSGGDLTFALWEVRGFAMLIGTYLLTCVFIQSEDRVNDLIWVVLIASSILAIENMLRWLLVLRADSSDDLAYDHVDSVVLVFAALLCLCLLAFGGTRAQRWYAAVELPVLIFAMEVMKRRAAFVILAVGILIFCMFLLRLRPRIFWRVVPPIALLCALYLAVFWNQNGTLAQPARAISSQFTPDPRDAASNNYRVIERYDIISNIQRAPLTGLGFGQQYVMYIPLPDLAGGWPLFHYETHDMVLWVWMKDGALGFAALFWLLGRGAYDGSRAVTTQREEWSLAGKLHALLTRGTDDMRAVDRAMRALHRNHYTSLRPTSQLARTKRRRHRGISKQALGLNVPTWERSDDRNSLTARESGVLAFLVVAVCMVPVQVVYSYVDLGLSAQRDTALIGLLLGVISQASTILQIEWTPRTRPARRPQEAESSLEDTRDRVRALVSRRPSKAGELQVVPSTLSTPKQASGAHRSVSRVPARGPVEVGKGAHSQGSDDALLPWEHS